MDVESDIYDQRRDVLVSVLACFAGKVNGKIPSAWDYGRLQTIFSVINHIEPRLQGQPKLPELRYRHNL